jgi:hypothetical protein
MKKSKTVLLAAALLVLSSEIVAREPEKAVTKPYASLWGANSKVKKKSYHLIGSPKEMDEVWSRHRGNTDFEYNGRPEVDFDRCLVVAIFEGESANTAGIECKEVLDEAKSITFRFRNRCYQTAQTARSASAYGFFVIPRTTKPIIIEEDIQHVLGRPPVWKERIRLDPKPGIGG